MKKLDTLVKQLLNILGALVIVSPLAAQYPTRTFFIEGRGGAAVPTFDIADVAKTGADLGGTIGYQLGQRLVLMGEFDYGKHQGKATGTTDINTLHYMGKVGYLVTRPRAKGWDFLVNLGAGAVTFDVDGAPKKFTYFAINAGAKLAYNFSPSFALVLSPQGDIAFSKKSTLTTTNAWVWPFTAGLRVRF